MTVSIVVHMATQTKEICEIGVGDYMKSTIQLALCVDSVAMRCDACDVIWNLCDFNSKLKQTDKLSIRKHIKYSAAIRFR